MRLRGLRVIIPVLVMTVGSVGAQTATEAKVKAAYLQKLPSFVDWPPDSFASRESPMTVGIVGAEAVYQELTRLAAGRLAQGRPIEVLRLSRATASLAVHVLYIGSEGRGEARSLLALASGQPVLVVTEHANGLLPGAVVNFVEVEGRIRLQASLPPRSATA